MRLFKKNDNILLLIWVKLDFFSFSPFVIKRFHWPSTTQRRLFAFLLAEIAESAFFLTEQSGGLDGIVESKMTTHSLSADSFSSFALGNDELWLNEVVGLSLYEKHSYDQIFVFTSYFKYRKRLVRF